MKRTLSHLLIQIVAALTITIASATNILFSYDSLYRLTNVNYGDGAIISYTYDTAGNRLTYSGAVANDTIAPSISITNPILGSSFTNITETINLSGTAADNIGVTLITWQNYSDGIGDAIGTDSWTINGIPLKVGDNFIDVTAYDAAGNSADAFLDVTYSPPVGPAIQTSLSDGSLNLSWSATSASGFVLQYANSLTPPIQWSNAVVNVTTNSGTLNVTLLPTNAQTFFRLKQ